MEDNLIIHKSDVPVTLKVNGQQVTFTQAEIINDKSTRTDTTLVFTHNGEYQVITMPWNEFFYLRNKLK